MQTLMRVLGRLVRVLVRLYHFLTDPGEVMKARMTFITNLEGVQTRNGKVIRRRNLGAGVVTITLVNTLVSDAVTGSSVVPTLARFKYMDTGTGTTAATDGDTALQTPSGLARVVATLSNSQSATTGNHTAILLYAGTITYTGALAITEWGLFDASTVGNLADHRIFSAYNVINGDQITWNYRLSLPSNN